MLKRGYQGTFHKFSEKHLDRYVGEFSERHNIRPLDTLDMMEALASGMAGQRKDLIGQSDIPGGRFASRRHNEG